MSDGPEHRFVNDDFGLSGKTALVTGSGRNIGRAIALELAARGANVIVNALGDEAEADAVAKEVEGLGARSLVVMGDASGLAIVELMRARAEEAFGGVDIYVSCAARRMYKDFFETTNDDWHYHLNQQLTASWYLAKRSCPACASADGAGWCISTVKTAGWVAGRVSPTRPPRAAFVP